MKKIVKTGLAAWAAAVVLAGLAAPGAAHAGVPVSFNANGGHFSTERWDEATETFIRETPTVMTNAGEWTGFVDEEEDGKRYYYGLSYRYGGDFQKPVRSGYAFDGWYTKKTGGELADWFDLYTTTRTVYAHWVKTNTVSLAASTGATNLTFVTGGDAPWFGQTNVYYDKSGHAARSGSIGDNEISWMETTVTGPGFVYFSWGTSCEDASVSSKVTNYYDYVSFSVDGVEVARLAGGEQGDDGIIWGYAEAGADIGRGKHTLRWQYQKDGPSAYVSGSFGHDCAWVDGIQWEPDTYNELEKALDNDDLTFRTGLTTAVGEDDTVWWGYYSQGSTHDGVDAAYTGYHDWIWGYLNAGYTGWMETTVPGPGTISFWWKATCTEWESYNDDGEVIGHYYPDSLDFLIDGSLKARLDGKTYNTWCKVNVSVPDGVHTLRWAERSEFWDEGRASWVDQVVWSPSHQTLTFDANGGSCGMATMPAAYEGVYGPLPTPTWSNHVFQGWYTARAGGSRVKDGQAVTPAAFRTLYARWTGKQATTFVVNGATAASTVRTNAIGGKYGPFPAVTRPGYELLGWFTAASGGSQVKEGAKVSAAATRKLYAHWKELTRQTVTFDPNGGTCKVRARTAVVGEAYTALATATREGFPFLGWYDARVGGNRVRLGDVVPPQAERTLFAHWGQTLRFDPNGGTCKVREGAAVVGEPYAALASATRDGYKFVGWYDAPEGGTRVRVGDPATPEAERTLWARWTRLPQTVHFDANGGTCNKTSGKYVIGEQYSGFKIPTRKGFTFKGWYDAPEGGKRVKNGMPVTEDTERTLYAHWQSTAGALSITGFSRTSRRAARASTTEYTLHISAPAGIPCEIQWTPSLGGEWTVLRLWTAPADGETAVPVVLPADSPAGFFRVVEAPAE